MLYETNTHSERQDTHLSNTHIERQNEERDEYFDAVNELNFDASDETYFDALNTFPNSEVFSPPRDEVYSSDNSLAVNNLFHTTLSHIVSNIIFNIKLRIFSRLAGLETMASDIRKLAQSREPALERLQLLSELFRKHIELIPADYRGLVHHSAELVSLGIELCQLVTLREVTVLTRVHLFTDYVKKLLCLEVVKSHIPAQDLDSLKSMTEQVSKLAGTLSLIQFLPQNTSFDEWLRIIADKQVLPESVQERLLQFLPLYQNLSTDLGEIRDRYPLPIADNWAARMTWLQQIMNDHTTARNLKSFISSDLKTMVNIVAPLAQLASRFPTDDSLIQQLSWAEREIATPSPEMRRLLAQSPINEFLTTVRQQLNDRITNPVLFNLLLELMDPRQSLLEKSINLTSIFFTGSYLRQVVSSALRTGVSYIPGGVQVLQVWDWYQTLPANLSWQETLTRFIGDLEQAIKADPQRLRSILPESILQSAEALSGILTLPIGQPWQEVLRWASQRLKVDGEYEWLYQRYIELCIARGVYESLQQGDARHREILLRELSVSLQEYLGLSPDSPLHGLLDLLPYFPLLVNMRQEIIAMPGNESWLGWSKNMLAVLEKHPHPTLEGLRQHLEMQIANYLSDKMMTGIDMLWAQMPEFRDPLVFPGAAAAVLPDTPSSWDAAALAAQNKKDKMGGEGAVAKEEQPDEAIASLITEDNQLLEELLNIADQYANGQLDPSVAENDAAWYAYAATGAGLTGGWLATLYLFWRTYAAAPHPVRTEDIELQVLHSEPANAQSGGDAVNDSLLAHTPPSVAPGHWKKHLLPALSLVGMGSATAYAVYTARSGGAEKPLTLQQVFWELLDEEQRYADMVEQTEVKSSVSEDVTHTAQSEETETPGGELYLSRGLRSVKEEDEDNISDEGDYNTRSENPIVSIDVLDPFFEKWNELNDEEVNNTLDEFKKTIKEKGNKKQRVTIFLDMLVAYILSKLYVKAQALKSNLSLLKSQADLENKPLEDDCFCMRSVAAVLSLLNNCVIEIKRKYPESSVVKKTKESEVYQSIKSVMNEYLPEYWGYCYSKKDIYTLNDAFLNGDVFVLNEIPQLKDFINSRVKHFKYIEGAQKAALNDYLTSVWRNTNNKNFTYQNPVEGGLYSDSDGTLKIYLSGVFWNYESSVSDNANAENTEGYPGGVIVNTLGERIELEKIGGENGTYGFFDTDNRLNEILEKNESENKYNILSGKIKRLYDEVVELMTSVQILETKLEEYGFLSPKNKQQIKIYKAKKEEYDKLRDEMKKNAFEWWANFGKNKSEVKDNKVYFYNYRNSYRYNIPNYSSDVTNENIIKLYHMSFRPGYYEYYEGIEDIDVSNEEKNAISQQTTNPGIDFIDSYIIDAIRGIEDIQGRKYPGSDHEGYWFSYISDDGLVYARDPAGIIQFESKKKNEILPLKEKIERLKKVKSRYGNRIKTIRNGVPSGIFMEDDNASLDNSDKNTKHNNKEAKALQFWLMQMWSGLHRVAPDIKAPTEGNIYLDTVKDGGLIIYLAGSFWDIEETQYGYEIRNSAGDSLHISWENDEFSLDDADKIDIYENYKYDILEHIGFTESTNDEDNDAQYNSDIIRYFNERGKVINEQGKVNVGTDLIGVAGTDIKVPLISVIKGKIPKGIALVKPDNIDSKTWIEILDGKIYDEIKEEVRIIENNKIAVDEFLKHTAGFISELKHPEPFLREWISLHSRRSPDDRLSVTIKTSVPDKFAKNNQFKKQEEDFIQRHPAIKMSFSIYDIVTGVASRILQQYDTITTKNIEWEVNKDVEELYKCRGKAFEEYKEHLASYREKIDDIDAYSSIVQKITGGEKFEISKILDDFEKNFNESTYTETQLQILSAIQIAKEIVSAASIALPLSPVKGFLLFTAIQSGGSLIQAGNSSTPEEKASYKKEALNSFIINFVMSIPGISARIPKLQNSLSKNKFVMGSYLRSGLKNFNEWKANKLVKNSASNESNVAKSSESFELVGRSYPMAKLHDAVDFSARKLQQLREGYEVLRLRGGGSGSSKLSKPGGSEHNDKKLIGVGSIGKVYSIGDGFVEKDYRGYIAPAGEAQGVRKNVLVEANNNTKGMNRMYGSGSATVITTPVVGDSGKRTVAVKMKHIPGETLSDIIKNGDLTKMREVVNLFKFSGVVDELTENLAKNGIVHNDINLANILYDVKSKKFNIIDFDSATYESVGKRINSGHESTTRNKLTQQFNELTRAVESKTGNAYSVSNDLSSLIDKENLSSGVLNLGEADLYGVMKTPSDEHYLKIHGKYVKLFPDSVKNRYKLHGKDEVITIEGSENGFNIKKNDMLDGATYSRELSNLGIPRPFRFHKSKLIGKINDGNIEISRDNGATWQRGSEFHLLAYRLQNAGGWRLLPDALRNKIVIGDHTFKRVKYNQDKFNEMKRIAQTYVLKPNSPERIARLQLDYQSGKEMSHEPVYDRYNNLSLDEKLDLFNKPNTDATTRGILAGKINESIENINLYEAAKSADAWLTSANKAKNVVLVPQNIFLKGRAGECLPESVLMGWALQSGQDVKLAKNLMSIYSSPNIADNSLYKALVELHADGNASRFSSKAIRDVNMSTLSEAELKLFPIINSSVRVDIPEHTMLISKVNKEGKVAYVFYDPNYGLAYFDKYKDMSAFFKKKFEAYNIPENSINLYHLDYSRLSEVKIKGRDLNEIINGEML